MDRKKRIENDKALIDKINNIRNEDITITRENDILCIKFELSNSIIIKEKKNNVFRRKEIKTCTFQLDFIEKYPKFPPKCWLVLEDNCVPFHPCIAPQKEGGKWIWHNPTYSSKENIEKYIFRIYTLLSAPHSIPENKSKNDEAYNYYKKQFDEQNEHDKTGKKFQVTNETRQEREKKISIRGKKFTIKSAKNTIKIGKQERDTFISEKIKGISDIDTNPVDNLSVFLTQKARQQIFEHIQWGNLNTNDNRAEQGGILLGKIYEDSHGLYGIVEEAISGRNAVGNAVELEMSHETWQSMMNEADRIAENNPELGYYIIGWYHTHPNNLEVFMSATDRNTQSLLFNQDWHFALVFNPHRKIWKAFHGKNALPCMAYTLDKDHFDNEQLSGIKSEEEKKKTDFLNEKKVVWFIVAVVVIMIVAVIIWFNIDNQSNEISKEKTTANSKQTDKPISDDDEIYSPQDNGNKASEDLEQKPDETKENSSTEDIQKENTQEKIIVITFEEDSVPIYPKPDENQAPLALEIDKNTIYNLNISSAKFEEQKKGGWLPVKFNGKEGWVKMDNKISYKEVEKK